MALTTNNICNEAMKHSLVELAKSVLKQNLTLLFSKLQTKQLKWNGYIFIIINIINENLQLSILQWEQFVKHSLSFVSYHYLT